MSLPMLAAHLAQKGRGNDSTLIHVSPREVLGLQNLAKMHGGSLTTNPHTGLPEAGFLDDVLGGVKGALPTLAGAALTYFSDGAISPAMAAGMVGGATALTSGNIGQGLQAGLGAYGGAGLTEGMVNAGTGQLAQAGTQAGVTAAQDMGLNGDAYVKTIDSARTAALEDAAKADRWDKLSAGFGAIKDSPMDYLKDNYGKIMMAASPAVMAMQQQQGGLPSLPQATGNFRAGHWNSDGTFTRTGTKPVSEGYFGMASGGAVKMAGGGWTQDQIDAMNNNWNAYQNDPAKLRQLMSDYGVGVQDIVGNVKGQTVESVAGTLNADNHGDFGGLHFNPNGQLYGTDWGGMLAQPIDTIKPPAGKTDPNYQLQIAPTPTQPSVEQTLQQQKESPFTNVTSSAPPAQTAPAANNPPAQASGIAALAPQTAQQTATPTKTSMSASDIATKWNDPSTSMTEKATWLRTSGLTVDDVATALKDAKAVYSTDPATLRTQIGNSLTTADGYKRGDFGYTPGILDTYIGAYKPQTADQFSASIAAENAANKAQFDAGVRAGPVSPTDAFTPVTNPNTGIAALTPGTATTPPAAAKAPATAAITGGIVAASPQAALEQAWTKFQNNPAALRAAITQTGLGVQDLVKTIPGLTLEAAAKILNSDGMANGWGGLRYNPDGSFRGTDWGGLSDATKATNYATAHNIANTWRDNIAAGTMPARRAVTGNDSDDIYAYLAGKGQNPYAKRMLMPTGYDASGNAVFRTAQTVIGHDKDGKPIYNDAGILNRDAKNSQNTQTVTPEAGSSLTSSTSSTDSTGPKGAGGQGNTGGTRAEGYGGVGHDPGEGSNYAANGGLNKNGKFKHYAAGGITALAQGGMGHLGSYSDGGRLLKGPGDGVSDSIPATIGNGQPARLADGEFVIPARIVSELGNGSTDAGAKQLYKMMSRIQANRAKTVGKNRTAVDSKSAKYLPA